MTRASLSARLAASVAILLAIMPVAWAGGSGLDEPDDADVGTPFFGIVKDLDNRGRAMPDAKVTASLKGGNTSFVMRADAQGHFKFTGFAKDVDPNAVEIACSVDGYKLERTVRRKLSNDPGAPVEVDCLMAKQQAAPPPK
ncbi:MAG TPA: carboxypeptidase-like regulatory domain-containing protein [Xanthobacteraceae bacterium]|nr:carboxypeptidase-like regulatory domain-containing protein [Xanthobacteraceae bacterium]